MFKKINNVLLCAICIVQFLLAMIFKGDIPIAIEKSDIILMLILSVMISMLVLISSNLHSFIFLAFLSVWLLDTIYLFKIPDSPKLLNLIGILTYIINVVIYIFKKKKDNA